LEISQTNCFRVPGNPAQGDYGTNSVRETSYQLFNALCIGAEVMLMTNFIVEEW